MDLRKVLRAGFYVTIVSLISACEQNYGVDLSGAASGSANAQGAAQSSSLQDSPFAFPSSSPLISPFSSSSGSTGGTVDPLPSPNPSLLPVPNGNNDGVGAALGQGGVGNVIVYGDEWVARLGDDSGNSSWTTSMQANVTNFWNDSLEYLTVNRPQKRVLFARFNNAGTAWDVVPISQWYTYLPKLQSGYLFHDYNPSSDGTLSASFLSNYDALVFVSYDPLLTTDLLTQYVQSGGSIMAMTIGFGIPGPNNSAANYECLNMNDILANFPYKYDCGNPNSNLLATGMLANVNTAALPFNNGYAVIPQSQAETPY
ncbi:MAG: hypothetical protein P4M08_03570 [Oligoflexia bacterium]|nr:hypothetical protein [Oligoflexia bacterium]